MRGIKFRAWNGGRKEMNHKVLVGNTCIGDGNYTAHCIHNGADWVNFDEHDDITLLQFTGLTDKNGVEIYEGDIVSSDYYLPDIKCVAAIKYNTGSMSFIADDGEQDAYKYGRLTVIGNIYENPELLEAGE